MRTTDRLRLSPRELEILALVADGESSLSIGRLLHLSPETVKHHRKSIHLKLGARSGTHAVAIAFRRGLID